MRLVCVCALLATIAGCAPAADLRVPAYEGPAISGRLLVLRGGPIVFTDEARAAAKDADGQIPEDRAWALVTEALSEAFAFSDVRVADLPADVSRHPLLVATQVVNEGRAQNRWKRSTRALPSGVSALASEGEYVLLVDTVHVRRSYWDMARGMLPGYNPLTGGFTVDVLLGSPSSQNGLLSEAPFALYRVGTEEPLVVGDLVGFGIGPDGQIGDSAWTRSFRLLARSLDTQQRIARR